MLCPYKVFESKDSPVDLTHGRPALGCWVGKEMSGHADRPNSSSADPSYGRPALSFWVDKENMGLKTDPGSPYGPILRETRTELLGRQGDSGSCGQTQVLCVDPSYGRFPLSCWVGKEIVGLADRPRFSVKTHVMGDPH